MKLFDPDPILADVPQYSVFLTVDELRESTLALAKKYPQTVEILPVGHSRAGDPIEAIKIGRGSKTALIFAMPHPNEPIGSMMLEYLSELLASDQDLRDRFDYTWYLIKCVDPDGARLNEGWFKGPFSITNYGRNYYRPPSHQQTEWTFPIEYKALKFSSPLPETRALMSLIEEIKPDLIYSLHNAGFGGAYFYLSEDLVELRQPFYDLVQEQGLHLHLGEPEAPWVTRFADAIFRVPSITQLYDFLEKQGVDPTLVITGGTCSSDYAQRFSDPFSLLCELPYFHNQAIHDTSPTGEIRRDVILEGVKRTREQVGIISRIYQSIKDELTAPSPFKDAIASFTKVIPQNLAAAENWARTDPETESIATVAERLDNLHIKRFYFGLLYLGMTVRMIEAQITAAGQSPRLCSARGDAIKAFEKVSAELEEELSYSVIPIRDLVRVQLGSVLLAASCLASRG